MKGLKKLAIAAIPSVLFVFGEVALMQDSQGTNVVYDSNGDIIFTAAEKESLAKFHKLQYCGRAKWEEASQKSEIYKHDFMAQGGDVKDIGALNWFVNHKIGDAVSDECIEHIKIDEAKESNSVDAFIKKYGEKVWNKVSPAPVPHLGFIPPPELYAP